MAIRFMNIKLTITAFLLTAAAALHAADDSLAYRLLDNAFGKTVMSGNAGIWFESIAYGVKEPKDIFSLPVYQVVKGGFLFMDGNKYEMQLGAMKALSDGKLMVVVDEQSKTMYVDSVSRAGFSPDSADALQVKKMFDGMTGGEAKFDYAGIEILNGKRYHKIKAVADDADKTQVHYWIEEASGKMYMMAEQQNAAYNVYVFRSVGKAPKAHEYVVHLPQKEIDTYYGYTVIDNRFIKIN